MLIIIIRMFKINITYLILIVYLFVSVRTEFVISDSLKFEAFETKGLRISYPAIEGIKLVGYHVNINKPMNGLEVGEIDVDLKQPTDGFWSYFDPDQNLKVGDVLYYWAFFQHDSLGYRKEGQWQISELIKKDAACKLTSTNIINGTLACSGQLIFEENFNALDQKFWTVEHYVPHFDPDFEFVTYQNNKDVIWVKENKLVIKPKCAQSVEEVKGKIDFRDKCTREKREECQAQSGSVFYLPPITSAKVVSNLYFKYGKIEIKAKLPAGDWIYPKIYLQKKSNPDHVLWIAYARGNENLIGNTNENLGGSLLFGGPVLSSSEPARSTYLRTKRNEKPFTSEVHIYSVIWRSDKIELYCDNNQYGIIDNDDIQKIDFGDFMRLVIGVAAGGINDFPDEFKSGGEDKPWINTDRSLVKKFFTGREQWISTWKNGEPLLEVYYVKIYAL